MSNKNDKVHVFYKCITMFSSFSKDCHLRDTSFDAFELAYRHYTRVMEDRKTEDRAITRNRWLTIIRNK